MGTKSLMMSSVRWPIIMTVTVITVANFTDL